MQFITGRVVIVGNKYEINKPDGSFSAIILVIKKRMNKKARNIAVKCYGKVADFVSTLNINDKVEIEYFIYSNKKTGVDDVWMTTLQAKSVIKIPTGKKNNSDSELKFN
jgi:hypothetical protein